jgi:hypothetical protein
VHLKKEALHAGLFSWVNDFFQLSVLGRDVFAVDF